jgi:two-component system phosphate regulon sensor histidine kinase PhoR
VELVTELSTNLEKSKSERVAPLNTSVFPTRLFRWFLGKQILTAGVLLIALDICLIIWIEGRGDLSQDARMLAREVVFLALFSSFVLMVSVSIFMARRLVIPLGRLIEKTRRLRKFPFEEEDYSHRELAFDEPGEWYDLERALNKLGRDLRMKTIRLSREKTELRTIMSAMNEAILAITVERKPLFYNPEFALLFGVENKVSDDLLISEMIRDPGVLEAYEQCLQGGASTKVKGGLNLDIKGEEKHFEVNISPLKKKHNQEVYGAVAVFAEITELKKADRLRIDFVGNVSHELRTPLTSIKGYLQTVRMDIEENRLNDCSDFLKIAEGNVDRLKLLVDDLLDLSKIESGDRLRKSVVDTRELTEGVLSMINSKDHVIQMNYSVDKFTADSTRVEQVLRNLLQNSVRYVPKGRNIWVDWSRGEGNQVYLRVKDNGPGIPEKHHNRLFERFYRIDEARARDVGGTGIGLSLVKHIMLRHGGNVYLNSEEGQGAEFICEFPQ